MLSKKTHTAKSFIRQVTKPSSKRSTWTLFHLCSCRDSSAQISRLELKTEVNPPSSTWLRHMLTHHLRACQSLVRLKVSAMFFRRICTTKTKKWISWPSSTCHRNPRRTLLELIQKRRLKEFSGTSANKMSLMDTPITACWDTGS